MVDFKEMYSLYFIEFSKIYKRLMELEICLKDKLYSSILSTYPSNCFVKFSPFLLSNKTLKKYYYDKYDKTTRRSITYNTLADISNDTSLTDELKLKTSLNVLYLADALKLLVEEPLFYNDKNLISKLYNTMPADFNYLKTMKGRLIKLRNQVAHYNFADYSKNRKKYIQALIYFEIHIGCSIHKLHNLPRLSNKPSTKKILRAIYQIEPDLFLDTPSPTPNQINKDRVLCDLYDDLAIINGWGYHELKSHWSVIRTKYAIKKEINDLQNPTP